MTNLPIDQVICGDSNEFLPTLPANSIDLILTDEPFGWSFMGSDWDLAIVPPGISREYLRVLKPGGLAMVMCGPRLDCLWRRARDLEEAGFNIALSPILYIYRSGFPKSLSISKDFDKAAFRAWLKSIDHGLSKSEANKVISAAVNGECPRGEHKDCDFPGADRDDAAAGRFAEEYAAKRHRDGAALLASVIARFWEPLSDDDKYKSWAEHAVEPDPSLPPGVRVKVGVADDRNANTGTDKLTWGGTLGAGVRYDTAPSVDLAKQYDGVKSVQLKPAFEFILMAQKPRIPGPIRKNVEKYGVGGINVRKAAIPFSVDDKPKGGYGGMDIGMGEVGETQDYSGAQECSPTGRFPANIIVSRDGLGKEGSRYFSLDRWAQEHGFAEDESWLAAAKAGLVQVAKPSRSEKNMGCSNLPLAKMTVGEDSEGKSDREWIERNPSHNDHSTVKPVKLMAWLLALGCPGGGTVLDPFAGSGTTGVAAVNGGWHYICIDSDGHYCDISEARIAYAKRAALDKDLEMSKL